MKRQLDKIFYPAAVAIIGASDRAGSVGFAVMRNLLDSGFEGKIFPVNIRHKTIQGQKCFRSVDDIPDDIDLAVIATPPQTVPGIVEELGKNNIEGAVILTAGFKEAGVKGKRLFDRIIRVAKKYHIRIIGPNCLGIINPAIGLNATFSARNALKGKIAFVSQSGALCASILDWSVDQSVGFSHFVSIGSIADVSFHDLIDYFATDQQTACILIYMESLKDARKFMSAARAFSRYKPIIILKAGISQEGAKAALSHTGSLAGNDEVYAAAFKRAGIIRVDKISQLFDCAQALAMQPRPEGNRLAIVTNSGGPGILATDYLVRNHGVLAKLSSDTLKKLNANLSPAWSKGNPVDILGDGTIEQYQLAMSICLQDPSVDGAIIIFTSQALRSDTDVASAIVEVVKESNQNKPVFSVWMGEEDVKAGREILEGGGIPVYRYPENAVDVFLKMYQHTRNLDLLFETPASIPDFIFQKDDARELIGKVLTAGETQLTEMQSKQLLRCYDIPVNLGKTVKTGRGALEYALEIGYPVALKVDAPEIGHKTDIGGVILDIRDSEQLGQAFRNMTKAVEKYAPEIHGFGITVEKFVDKKFEILIGSKKDPVFGPVIVFGSGGITVELFNDTNLELPPLNMALARKLIEPTKAAKLISGFRNLPKVDLQELRMLLCKFAYLVMDFPEILEVDINPFAVDELGGIALDAKVILDPKARIESPHEYAHLVISPYPEKWKKTIRLKNDTTILLRPIRPEDEPLEAELFDYLSRETIYFRFFGFISEPTHEMLSRFTQIDYDREMALVAEIKSGSRSKLIAVVRIVGDAWGQEAEYAIVVADQWQRHGLGTIMTNSIIEIAKSQGYKKLTANVLKSNKSMLNLFKKLGWRISSLDNQTKYAELRL